MAKAIRLGKHVSPRAMRRTFQDLARAASMGDLVTRAVSGHATEQMQHHYGTVRMDEMRGGLDRVAALADLDAFRPGGVLGGVHKEVMAKSA